MNRYNIEIAEKFNKLANLLEIQGANPFRVRAYRNAARTIRGLGKNVSDLIAEGSDLTDLPGIGKDLADKIKVMIKTGKLPLLDQIEKKIPPLLNELMRIEGLGGKRIQILYKKLKIKNLKDLKESLEKGKVRKLKGFGEKTEQKILQGISNVNQYTKKIKLADVMPIVETLINYLKKKTSVIIECAGSFRRHKETIADLDILAITDDSKSIIEHFVNFDETAEVLAKGTTRSTIRLYSGLQVDLRVVPKKSYGAALLYFTGSKEHNIAIRRLGLQRKLKVNEYGVFKGKKQIAGVSEKEIYTLFKLPYIEPELREDRGELEAAVKNKLPKLITLDDIRGDLHCHTAATDGNASLEVMAKAAETLGYDYLAITDHSMHLAMVHGLNKKSLFEQIKLIDKLNSKLKKLVILKSIEVDILEDGKLDLPNDILKELDFTVCSIHSKFNLSSKKQTERIIKAMDNLYFTILGHATGRLINRREPYSIDMECIINAAKERRCILELNAQPDRLDLNDIYCKMAKEIGVKIAISTDAHSIGQLSYMEFGVYQARRGWLEADDVVNTRSLKNLKKILSKSL